MPSLPLFHFIPEITAAFDEVAAPVSIAGAGDLPSRFLVSDLAAESIAYAGAMLQRYRYGHSDVEPVTVDRRLAALWFGMTVRPIGWQLPTLWDAVAGDYQTADGWIRLHTNAPHHLSAALAVLDQPAERDAVAKAVRRWKADELERAVVEQGGCAAAMRSLTDWTQHAQGRAVHAEPLVQVAQVDEVRHGAKGHHAISSIHSERPLSGIKILDLTRVLAGPVAGRFLAGYGANVLRIDPPHWHEPAAELEVTLGKRCARLDLQQKPDLAVLKQRLAECDVFLHGYRPGALDSLGLGESVRHEINPYAIDVSLCAYGWAGSWAGRRGFDSLMQMSCGIAHQGMMMSGAEKPVPLPVQALDHATGYLMAAAVLKGLIQRREQGKVTHARLSLARTAQLLVSRGHNHQPTPLAAETVADVAAAIEPTSWGVAQRIKFPLHIPDCPAHWTHPAAKLGCAVATHW